jgi:uncharacterized cupin superfamily protein
MKSFNVHEATFEYDDTDPEGYRAGMQRFGPELDGKRLGATVYELPPGQALCPYHYETEEEWLLVLQGELTVRHPGGEDVLGPGDVVAFGVGPAGAHKTTNRGTETVRLLMWSNKDESGYCVYPDSNKLQRWAPGENTRIKMGPAAAYYDDEPLS